MLFAQFAIKTVDDVVESGEQNKPVVLLAKFAPNISLNPSIDHSL